MTYEHNIALESIEHNGRTIDYATTVVPGLTADYDETTTTASATPTIQNCILVFYPLGANRRMISSWRDRLHPLHPTRLICVNRPGKHTTSGLSGSSGKDPNVMLETTSADIVAVLDHLKVDQVSLLALCAGNPFAMAFAAKHPDRTTGRYVGLAAWVLPGDCETASTTWTFKLGAAIPSFASPLVATISNTVGNSMTSLPDSWVESALKGKLSQVEQDAFHEIYGGDNNNHNNNTQEEGMIKENDDVVDSSSGCCSGGNGNNSNNNNNPSQFMENMHWSQQEKGGQTQDLYVLLGGTGLIPYDKVAANQTIMTFWHGRDDSMVPLKSLEWLTGSALLLSSNTADNNNKKSSATLHVLEDASHEGVLFGLHHKTMGDEMEKALGLR